MYVCLVPLCAQDVEDKTMSKETFFYTLNISNRLDNSKSRAKDCLPQVPWARVHCTEAKCHCLQVCLHHEHQQYVYKSI